jgi:anti-sigma regulatory factor (Ser/Thr protein kinase)
MDTSHWAIGVDADAGDVETVRWAVRDELRACGVDRVGEAELLAWELITNALFHAHTPVAVDVSHQGGRARVEVHDGSRTDLAPQHFDPQRVGGHGLELVDKLSLAWGVADEGQGKAVWFEVACDRKPRRPAA